MADATPGSGAPSSNRNVMILLSYLWLLALIPVLLVVGLVAGALLWKRRRGDRAAGGRAGEDRALRPLRRRGIPLVPAEGRQLFEIRLDQLEAEVESYDLGARSLRTSRRSSSGAASRGRRGARARLTRTMMRVVTRRR